LHPVRATRAHRSSLVAQCLPLIDHVWRELGSRKFQLAASASRRSALADRTIPGANSLSTNNGAEVISHDYRVRQQARFGRLAQPEPAFGFDVRNFKCGNNTKTMSPRRRFIIGGHFGRSQSCAKGQPTTQVGRLRLVYSFVTKVDWAGRFIHVTITRAKLRPQLARMLHKRPYPVNNRGSLWPALCNQRNKLFRRFTADVRLRPPDTRVGVAGRNPRRSYRSRQIG
jgi:hypothetical protein